MHVILEAIVSESERTSMGSNTCVWDQLVDNQNLGLDHRHLEGVFGNYKDLHSGWPHVFVSMFGLANSIAGRLNCRAEVILSLPQETQKIDRYTLGQFFTY